MYSLSSKSLKVSPPAVSLGLTSIHRGKKRSVYSQRKSLVLPPKIVMGSVVRHVLLVLYLLTEKTFPEQQRFPFCCFFGAGCLSTILYHIVYIRWFRWEVSVMRDVFVC